MNTIVDRKSKEDVPLFSGTVGELLDKHYHIELARSYCHIAKNQQR